MHRLVLAVNEYECGIVPEELREIGKVRLWVSDKEEEREKSLGRDRDVTAAGSNRV